MLRSVRNPSWCAGVILLSATCAAAQNIDVLSDWYGNGVHAYFAGQDSRADQHLTQAIQSGSKDPRCYYFRGLVRMRQGQQWLAEEDMQTAATLEIQDVDGMYPVAHSLQRIQGRNRLKLEQYRQRARIASYNRQKRANQQRYETLKRREEAVLRRQMELPLEQLTPPGTPVAPPAAQPPAAKAAPAAEPAAEPPTLPLQPAQPAPMPAADVASPPDDAEIDPFAEPPADAAPADEPADEPSEEPSEEASPFGDEPADQPDEPAAEEPADETDPSEPEGLGGALDDLLGSDAPADEATDEPPADESAEEPAADEPAADEGTEDSSTPEEGDGEEVNPFEL